jgi:Domain of unknown function (DUF4145)
MLTVAVCASCGDHNVFVRRWQYVRTPVGPAAQETAWFKRVHPMGRAPKELANIAMAHLQPYHAATASLNVSPEACGGISRRQGILREQGQQKDLVQQIGALLNEDDAKKQLLVALHETVDFIRNYGNFGAHPMNDLRCRSFLLIRGEAD